MNKKILIFLFTVLLLFNILTITIEAATPTTDKLWRYDFQSVDNITYDGTVHSTGSTKHKTHNVSDSFYVSGRTLPFDKGYVEFNLTDIPDTSVITSATLWLNRTNAGGWDNGDILYFQRIDVQPTVANAYQLWDNYTYEYADIEIGSNSQDPINMTPAQWISYGSEAKYAQLLSDLNDALTQNWFAFGFYVYDNNGNLVLVNFASEESGDSQNNSCSNSSPILYLTYLETDPYYRLHFRYENSTYKQATGDYWNSYINFSRWPCSNHRLYVHYENGSTFWYNINRSWYENNSYNPYIDINISSPVLYFEFFWNYTVNTTCSDCNYTASYSRKLTPYAATPNGANYDLTFYMIVNRNVYNEYYGRFNSGCQNYIEYNLTDNLVNFDFEFDDRSHLFDTRTSWDSRARFYCYNATTEHIIHEEYWDTQQQVHPTLIFEKKYITGVNCSHDSGYLYENIGPAPNNQWVYPYTARIIVINDRSTAEMESTANYNLLYGWESNGTGLWVYFYDEDEDATLINVSVFDTTLNMVWYSEVSNFFNNFSYGNANQNFSYFINITITNSSGTYLIPFWIFPEETALETAATINATLTTIFGYLPHRTYAEGETYWMDYNNILIGILFVFVFGIISTYVSLGAGIFAGGFAILGYGAFVTGLLSILPYAGVFIMFIGILLLISGDEKL